MMLIMTNEKMERAVKRLSLSANILPIYLFFSRPLSFYKGRRFPCLIESPFNFGDKIDIDDLGACNKVIWLHYDWFSLQKTLQHWILNSPSMFSENPC